MSRPFQINYQKQTISKVFFNVVLKYLIIYDIMVLASPHLLGHLLANSTTRHL
jgi:hypothetical protein